MITPDWQTSGTKEEIEKDIGNGFKLRVGWIESNTDTVLVTELRPMAPHLTPVYKIQCWNRTGIRIELANLLGMPVLEISN